MFLVRMDSSTYFASKKEDRYQLIVLCKTCMKELHENFFQKNVIVFKFREMLNGVGCRGQRSWQYLQAKLSRELFMHFRSKHKIT